jgi:hypothetical protein
MGISSKPCIPIGVIYYRDYGYYLQYRWILRYTIDMSILVDLNGTIAREGKPIQKTIDYLKTVTEDIYIVSGSTISKEQEYANLLAQFGISYVKIILNPINQDTDVSFKVSVAMTIPNLSFAIDNNTKILAAYRDAGIKAIDVRDI